MKSVVCQVRRSIFFLLVISWVLVIRCLELPSSEPLVGRSPDSRSELGDRQWRRRWQRRLPLLVSFEGSSSWLGRPNDSTHTTIRGVDAVFCSCVVSSFHTFLIRVDAFAGHIRFGDVEFF